MLLVNSCYRVGDVIEGNVVMHEGIRGKGEEEEKKEKKEN